MNDWWTIGIHGFQKAPNGQSSDPGLKEVKDFHLGWRQDIAVSEPLAVSPLTSAC